MIQLLIYTLPQLMELQAQTTRVIMADSPFETNLKVIHQRWPQLAKMLEQVSRMPPSLDVSLAQGLDSTLVINGIQLTSRHNRLLEAQQQSSQLPQHKSITLYGTALGDLQQELLARTSLTGLNVAILNEYIFVLVLQLLDQTHWLSDPRVHLLMACDHKELQPPYIVAPAELVLVSDRNRNIRDRLCSDLEATNVANRLNTTISEQVARFAQNQHYWRKDAQVQSLFNTLQQGQEAYVIAAGPSLEQHYAYLQRCRNKAVPPVIICVDTAARALLAHHIMPDIVVTADYHVNNRHLPNELLASTCKLVYFPITDGELLAHFPGTRYVALNNTSMFQSVRHELTAANLYMHGSVIHPATDLAVRMGASRVVFFGADFAFSHQKTHANWKDGEIGISYQQATDWTMNFYGEKVPTLPNLTTYRIGIERYIQQHPAVTFFNTSKAGAVIAGTQDYPEFL